MNNQPEMAGMAFGRGVAAIITTGFGFIWLGWGLSEIRNLPATVWVAHLSLAVALMAFAVTAVRRARKMIKAQGMSQDDFWRKRRKAFGFVTLFEITGCIAVVVLANLFRQPQSIAVGISLVVGLHFLPLGRVFGVASYYWIGSLIIAWDILTMTTSKPSNWTASAGIATGLILWASAINALVRSFGFVREG